MMPNMHPHDGRGKGKGTGGGRNGRNTGPCMKGGPGHGEGKGKGKGTGRMDKKVKLLAKTRKVAVIEKWASGWNSPSVPGCVFASREQLVRVLAKKGEGWEGEPEGWDRDSMKKYLKSMGGDVSECMKKIKGHVDDEGAFCASLMDEIKGDTGWRGD